MNKQSDIVQQIDREQIPIYPHLPSSIFFCDGGYWPKVNKVMFGTCIEYISNFPNISLQEIFNSIIEGTLPENITRKEHFYMEKYLNAFKNNHSLIAEILTLSKTLFIISHNRLLQSRSSITLYMDNYPLYLMVIGARHTGKNSVYITWLRHCKNLLVRMSKKYQYFDKRFYIKHISGKEMKRILGH